MTSTEATDARAPAGRMTPIFILGAPRSGTTLLGGMLCRHERVAGVHAARYRGLKESDLFFSFERSFPSLEHPVDLVRFVEAFSATDYFRLSGVEKELFYRRKPKDVGSFFRLLMDEYARRRGCDFWVEKSPAHTLCYRRLERHFPDAALIVIRRNVVDCVRSNLGARPERRSSVRSGMLRYLGILKITVSFSIYNAMLDLIQRRSGQVAVALEYGELVRDKPAACARICRGLGIPYEEAMTIPPYRANTSFPGGDARRAQVLSPLETLLVRLVAAVFRLVPRRLAPLISFLVFGKRRRRPLAHHWGMLLEEHGFDARLAPCGWRGVPHESRGGTRAA
jgi:hypothetical protein